LDSQFWRSSGTLWANPVNLLQSNFFTQITDSSVAGVYFGVGTGRISDMAVRQSMVIVSGVFLLDVEVISL
jgi:hypothetical protein